MVSSQPEKKVLRKRRWVSRRDFLKLAAGTAVAVGSVSLVPKGVKALAGNETQPTPPVGGLTYKGKITQADRLAAAEVRASLMQGKDLTGLKAPVPGGVPDYFGPYPNYANSKRPTVNITTGAITGGIRKFVDSLPGLGPTGANNLGVYISVAHPDTITYPGCDYYEISLREYTQQMHSDLPLTKLRGYVQTNNGTDALGANTVVPDAIHYLGPLIVAQKGRPTRVKFTNELPTGAAGDLFIPVDTSYMGAGDGPSGGQYTENRATLHLHGGDTVWISDGTPHQWVTPATETTPYPKGVSVQYVPDMPNPGPGALTFFYSNQQTARLMFYHDHAYGITRLNVYVGEASGYLLTDPLEQDMINATNNTGINPTLAKVLPDIGIPLVIQDRTFVDATTIAAQDPTWNGGSTPGTPVSGDLWFPHVYMTNQNPYDPTGANPMGRWDYGPWFWPPFTNITYGPVANPYYDPINAPWEPPVIPGVPDISGVPESFMDTPIVNGVAYPYMKVGRRAYRFRILNACNDRYLNLQLYFVGLTIVVVNPGSGYSATPTVTLSGGGATTQATAKAIIVNGQITAIQILTPGVGYVSAPTVAITDTTGTGAVAVAGYDTEVKMVPATPNSGLPASWPTDGRDGGVPDPAFAGPNIIQIGHEGGFLPAPAEIPATPVGYDYNRRSIVVLNVLNKSLFLGPAERADVIIDFGGLPRDAKLILYNDAPAPVPGFDPRLDYYTGDVDYTTTGGAPTTMPGYGPNTRTIMRFEIDITLGDTMVPYDIATLQTVLPKAYAASLPQPIIPQAAYNTPFAATYPADNYVRIQDTSKTFVPAGSALPITKDFEPKAIIEDFQVDYGRMNAILGNEIPHTNLTNQTSVIQAYVDPPVEILRDAPASVLVGSALDNSQIWKITHNGVDTHAIHFHLFNVQLINRVGWDGAIRPPDANELGWKDTVRMNPLEDCIVALKPHKMTNIPFSVPNSVRYLNPITPPLSTMGFTQVAPDGNPTTVSNVQVNFGWEYVYHCHLLGHEENDMMRPMAFAVDPEPPALTASVSGSNVILTWVNTAQSATGFLVERATDPAFTAGYVSWTLGLVTTLTDTGAMTGHTTLFYRITALNTVGSSVAGYPQTTATSKVVTVNHETFLLTRGSHNEIFHRAYNAMNSTWGPWIQWPGASTPEAIAGAVYKGKLHSIHKSADGTTLWYGSLDLATNTYSAFTIVGDALTVTTSSPFVLTSNGAYLVLILRAQDNSIRYRVFNDLTGSFDAWQTLSGAATAQGPSAALVGDVLHVIHQGTTNPNFFHASINLRTNVFTPWQFVDGSSPSPSTLVSNGSTLVLLHQGFTNVMFYRLYTIATNTWGPWRSLPGATSTAIAATRILRNNLYLIHIGGGGQLFFGSVNLGSSTFGGWSTISGATTSIPTLTN